jgi:glucose-1-phosphate thymidylyltransferase
MKGIILAGGTGSRLSPLTDIINKFLLPVYDKPMIQYSVESLRNAGVTDIAIILGQKSAGQTIDFLQSGKKFGVKFTYLYQDKPLGVANALSYAEEFANNQPICVMCADNIIFDDITPFVKDFKMGAFISCKEFNDIETLKRFAIVYKDEKGKVTHLEEKPKNPQSNLAFAGIQIYDNRVWDIIPTLKPSARGEYEITHVINNYIEQDEFNYGLLREDWIDAGTPDALLEAQLVVANRIKGGQN